MRKATPQEIGSEFWYIPICEDNNFLFPPDTVWYLSGRSAQEQIIADIKAKHNVKRAWLPSWCCESMIIPFISSGIEVEFYPVYIQNGQLMRDLSCAADCDILFLMDYFGYTFGDSYCDYPGIVIRDVTHSIFSKSYTDADYYFGSLRKWAGFWTGGYAWGFNGTSLQADHKYVSLRRTAMENKSQYIKGITSSKEYLLEFSKAEEHLEHCAPAGADARDIQMAGKIDIDFLVEQRRKNAFKLLSELSDIAIFPEINDFECPMFVPVIVPNGKRDQLRQHLIKQEIYCPVHWMLTQYHKPDKKMMDIYNNELSIVCDQRYDESHMERIIKAIHQF